MYVCKTVSFGRSAVSELYVTRQDFICLSVWWSVSPPVRRFVGPSWPGWEPCLVSLNPVPANGVWQLHRAPSSFQCFNKNAQKCVKFGDFSSIGISYMIAMIIHGNHWFQNMKCKTWHCKLSWPLMHLTNRDVEYIVDEIQGTSGYTEAKKKLNGNLGQRQSCQISLCANHTFVPWLCKVVMAQSAFKERCNVKAKTRDTLYYHY